MIMVGITAVSTMVGAGVTTIHTTGVVGITAGTTGTTTTTTHGITGTTTLTKTPPTTMVTDPMSVHPSETTPAIAVKVLMVQKEPTEAMATMTTTTTIQ